MLTRRVACAAALLLIGRGALAQVPNPPSWWGNSLDPAVDQVCYTMADGLYPPTPSGVIISPGCPPPMWSASPNVTSAAGGKLNMPLGQASYVQATICNATMPPDFKEVHGYVDLYA